MILYSCLELVSLSPPPVAAGGGFFYSNPLKIEQVVSSEFRANVLLASTKCIEFDEFCF